ncbi:MAG: RluA family pseudouridine synthase [Pseudomonadota bacterium]|nr:RluA family pseudouridine synthase [Pseudomonadota bacterium]
MSTPANIKDDTAVRQFTVGPDDDGVRLDRWFKRHLPLIGFATISRWARTGQIRVDGKRADPADRLTTGQVLRVPPGGLEKPGSAGGSARAVRPRPELSEEQLAKADAMLIHKTAAALVINKPPGLATQGGTGTYEHVDGLLDAYAHGAEPRPRLVHRLDKDTSGVLLVARTPGSAAWFAKRFATRAARKIYWALIVGVPSIEEGFIDLPLGKQPGSGGEKMMVDESEHGQAARTRYRVLEFAGNHAAWVELQPLTGRTHQLRVHMAAIGHPIVGDGKYGGPDAFLTGSISRKMHLHARRLIIGMPGGEDLDVTAELPDHFAASMAQLGFDAALGFALPEAPPPPGKVEKKAAAKAHAKQYRKERRGERRGRGSAGDGDGRGADKFAPAKSPRTNAVRPAGKAASRPAKSPASRPAVKGPTRPASKSPAGAFSKSPGGAPRKR